MKGDGRIDAETAGRALEMLNVDEYGLDGMDARILRAIVESFEGGPVGLSSLAVAVGEDASTLEEVFEPYLIQNGLSAAHGPGSCGDAEGIPALRIRAPGRPGQMSRGPCSAMTADPRTLRTADFDYDLPASLIASRPAERRDASRLLALDHQTGSDP